MADSGIHWIDVTFDWCVYALFDLADLLGITYEEINVWLFVVALPLALAMSIAANYFLFLRLKSAKVQ